MTENLEFVQKPGVRLRMLSKKVAKLEVIILEADKGKWFIMVDKPTYLFMAGDHKADVVVDQDEPRPGGSQ